MNEYPFKPGDLLFFAQGEEDNPNEFFLLLEITKEKLPGAFIGSTSEEDMFCGLYCQSKRLCRFFAWRFDPDNYRRPENDYEELQP